jgi:hypothetical protein
VIAVSSSSFNSDNGFNGLPNIKAWHSQKIC